MRKITIIIFLFAFVGVCFGATVHLRKGGTVEGEVISKDDEKFVIKTAEGEKTFKWRSVKNKSIKEMHPELYEALKTKALEKKKKKKLEKNKVESSSKYSDLSNLRLKVKTSEKKGPKKRIDTGDRGRHYERKNEGVLDITFDNLNSKKIYKLKIQYSHYIELENQERVIKHSIEIIKNDIIENQNVFTVRCLSKSYFSRSHKPRPGYHFTGGKRSKHEQNKKTAGWDISIWLDGKLIYKEEKGKDKEYFIVKKL